MIMSNASFTRSSTGTAGGHAAGNSAAGTNQPQAPRAPWRDWLALALLMFPVLLVAVDNTALTFALPAIARSLDASGVELLWIVDAYPLVLAGLLVAMGSLGDRIGRRRLLFIGSTGFAAVSAVTAFAPSAEWLIAGRAGLGFFGAMLMPSTLSLIRNIFPEPNRRRLAVAIWAAGFSGGAALGPIFGGWLVEHFWWGAVLLVAVPIILPLLVLGPALIPESRDPNPGRVDVPSIVLSLLVMVPVVYGIKILATHGLALEPLAAIGFGLLMGYVFIRRQRQLLRAACRGTAWQATRHRTARARNRTAPLLDLSLFGNRVFSTAIIANVLALFSFNGFILFLAQHLQLLEGQSPSESGVAMVPALIATVAGRPAGGAAGEEGPPWFCGRGRAAPERRRLLPGGLRRSRQRPGAAAGGPAGAVPWRRRRGNHLQRPDPRCRPGGEVRGGGRDFRDRLRNRLPAGHRHPRLHPDGLLPGQSPASRRRRRTRHRPRHQPRRARRSPGPWNWHRPSRDRWRTP